MSFKTNMTKSLAKNKKQILDQWFDATINSYPPETARVLGRIKNKFDNPVGAATHESLEAVFEEMINRMDASALEEALDPIIRIRAVQSFTPAKALVFVFELKEIGKKILAPELYETFDRQVDKIALAAFNRFMKCRESIFLLKATEAKRRIHSAFERAGLVTELKEKDLF
ncbi:MAG: RsbRD N-terminal domain-containing protein [Desulfobacterium sp.]|nr:RsbRD N-terminal domain-containing protein [Desulfobacterium sp.]